MNIKALLLEAPDNQIDPAVLNVIRTWSEPQTALNVLEALDTAVYCGGASEFAMQALNALLAIAIKTENTTFESVVQRATWRNKD